MTERGARSMRWLSFALLALPLCLIVYGLWLGTTAPTERAKVLRLGHVLNDQHPVHLGMMVFADEVQRLSEGALRVDIFADGQLGTERELLELLQIGSVALTKVSAGQLENFTPNYSVLSLPYLFDDSAHFWRFAESTAGADLLDAPRAFRLKGLTFYDAGARSFYFGRGQSPIRSPEDLRGRAVRVMPSRTAIRMVEALGAKPVPIPFGELYSALDTGTVDGAENNPPSLFTSRQYEVSESYTLNEHSMVPDVLVISTDTWDRLSQQEQRWLTEAARFSAQKQRHYWAESEAQSLQAMRAAGLSIIEEIDRAAFRERVSAVYALPEFQQPDRLALIEAIRQQSRQEASQ